MVPTSRLITRFSQDIQTVDGTMAGLLLSTSNCTAVLVFNFIGILITAGIPSLIPGVTAVILVVTLGRVYIAAQLPFKRHRSVEKAPILSNLAAVLIGMGRRCLIPSDGN
jgi:hypothetical protein